MPSTPLTVATLRRRFLLASSALIIVVVGATVWSFHAGYGTPGYHSSPRGAEWSAAYGSSHATPPTAAQQSATLVATQVYRRQIVTTAQEFSTQSSALVRDVRAGNLDAARADELAAQGSFDVLRSSLSTGLGATAPLDTLVANQSPGLAPTGLHAVERALWAGNLSDALAPATAVATTASELPFVLFRTIVDPSVICTRIQELLSWTVESVIASPQEVFSHQDLVDVRASVGSITSPLDAIERLGRLVDRAHSDEVSRNVARLTATLATLASAHVDAEVSPATWRVLATQMDSLVTSLGQLSGSLSGFGSGRPYA